MKLHWTFPQECPPFLSSLKTLLSGSQSASLSLPKTYLYSRDLSTVSDILRGLDRERRYINLEIRYDTKLPSPKFENHMRWLTIRAAQYLHNTSFPLDRFPLLHLPHAICIILYLSRRSQSTLPTWITQVSSYQATYSNTNNRHVRKHLCYFYVSLNNYG